MNLAEVAARKKDVPASLSALGKFSHYKPESDNIVRKAEVKSSPALEGMKKAWAECGEIENFEKSYSEMLVRIKDIRYSAKDVEAFCIMLPEFQNEANFSFKAGLYLSALMNNCAEDGFNIATIHIDIPINHLGYQNTKSIIVEGDAGHFLGAWMKSGNLTVKGSVDHHLGTGMEGGTLTVEGGAGMFIGHTLYGGTIVVNGNAGSNIGSQMEGGEIRLFGEKFALNHDIKGGKIFHKEELIWPEGGGSG